MSKKANKTKRYGKRYANPPIDFSLFINLSEENKKALKPKPNLLERIKEQRKKEEEEKAEKEEEGKYLKDTFCQGLSDPVDEEKTPQEVLKPSGLFPGVPYAQSFEDLKVLRDPYRRLEVAIPPTPEIKELEEFSASFCSGVPKKRGSYLETLEEINTSHKPKAQSLPKTHLSPSKATFKQQDMEKAKYQVSTTNELSKQKHPSSETDQLGPPSPPRQRVESLPELSPKKASTTTSKTSPTNHSGEESLLPEVKKSPIMQTSSPSKAFGSDSETYFPRGTIIPGGFVSNEELSYPVLPAEEVQSILLGSTES